MPKGKLPSEFGEEKHLAQRRYQWKQRATRKLAPSHHNEPLDFFFQHERAVERLDTLVNYDPTETIQWVILISQIFIGSPSRITMGQIFILRFIVGMTLEEVADEYCLTRERIRQIEAHALRIIRHPKHRG